MKLRKITFVCLMISVLTFFDCSNVPEEHVVSVEELHTLLKDAEITVLDVRTPEEISEGKITSAALEANFQDAHFIENVIDHISVDENVYIYCKGGGRSSKALAKLQELGYLKVYNVEGGITAWKAKGYPIE